MVAFRKKQYWRHSVAARRTAVEDQGGLLSDDDSHSELEDKNQDGDDEDDEAESQTTALVLSECYRNALHVIGGDR